MQCGAMGQCHRAVLFSRQATADRIEHSRLTRGACIKARHRLDQVGDGCLNYGAPNYGCHFVRCGLIG